MSTTIAVQAVPLCTADKWGMVTCLNIHKSMNSPAPILEGWGYKTAGFKQLVHGSQQNLEIPLYWSCLTTAWYCPSQQRQT